MAFEIPYDVISQVQNLLRKEANLASYDPEDPSIPKLPSLEDSISELDPSPPYLRCRHCRGKLLRGLQSAFCVFCGEEQKREVPPEPIKFVSTRGYRWFLESLNLDGSEMVGPSAEAKELNRGQSTQQAEIPVSDLLDLEINWTEPEENGAAVTNVASVQNKSSLNLAGVDLDNFFSEAQGDIASTASDENFVLNKQIDKSNAFQSQGNLSLFENVQPSETAVRLTKDESGDSFSGWDVEFQSAGSGTFYKDKASKSFDPSVGSTVDLSAHLDAVFGPGKDPIDGQAKEEAVPSASNTNDWFPDDLWSSSNLGSAGQVEQFEMTKNDRASEMLDNANNISSTKVDRIQDDLWKTSTNKAPDIKTVDEDNSFDSWNYSAQDPPNYPWKQTTVGMTSSSEQNSDVNLFSSTNNLQEMDFGSFSQPDLFSGVSSNQNSSAEVKNLLAEASVSDRIADMSAKDGGSAEEVLKGEDVSETTSKSKADDVKILLSQMHDLSFMLEGNLSIPSKKIDGNPPSSRH